MRPGIADHAEKHRADVPVQAPQPVGHHNAHDGRHGLDDVLRVFVKSISDIANVMGVRCTAEFVEDVETERLLQQMGLDLAQGFGICRPGDIEQLRRFLASLDESPAARAVRAASG